MDILLSVLEQGLIYGIVALGSYISYKILDFPDLSVEGTFPLGASVTAMLITKEYDPYLACLISLLVGGIAGMLTGLIHVKLEITDLLSGIIILTGLYSINLVINGTANVPIFGNETIFNSSLSLYIPEYFRKLIISFLLFMFAKFILDWYFKTKSGFLLRASGDNIQYVTSLGKNYGYMKIIGLSLANGLAALSGSIMCQYQRYFEISMGTGIIITGLASVIIGISIFKNFTFVKATTITLLGCIIFRICYAISIAIGFKSEYMKLVIAVLFLAAIVLNGDKYGVNKLFKNKKGGK